MRFAQGQRSIQRVSSTSKYNLEKPAAEMAAYLAQGFRRAFGTDHS
jgi:hypothetical protein